MIKRLSIPLLIMMHVNCYSQIFFEDRAVDLGLDITCGSTFLGNGVSFVDFDGDGLDDLTFATEVDQPVRFFKNQGGSFVEHFFNYTDPNRATKQINWVDIDNDGDKDLFVTSHTEGNKLYENQGNNNLLDITSDSNLPITNLGTYGASWGDYNNDGYLDVFISNRENNTIPNYLFKNLGNKTFLDVSGEAGISDLNQVSFCSAFIDFNNDGWQDIYVSNDRFENKNVMYKNNGDGTFSDVSESSKTDIIADAMSVTVGDYNKDGWFDIYVTNSPVGNYLLVNQGNETFINQGNESGTAFYSWGWGAVFLDADNDDDIDLYVSGDRDGSNPYLPSAAFYENNNDLTFSESVDNGFENDTSASFSNAIGDFDNDGRTDIVVTNVDDPVFAWKNLSVTSNNWLKLKLIGTTSNRDAVGTRIEISENGNQQFHYVNCGEGYLSQNSFSEYIGVGGTTVIDYIKVNWLSGIEEYFYDVGVNQTFEIIEGTGTLSTETSENLILKLSPNPVENELNIENNSLFTRYKIFNNLGQLIVNHSADFPIARIDVSTLPSGLYFLRFTGDEKEFSFKFIKI